MTFSGFGSWLRAAFSGVKKLPRLFDVLALMVLKEVSAEFDFPRRCLVLNVILHLEFLGEKDLII